MSYRLAIFDMDGTILDTLGDLTSAVNYAMRAQGYPEHTIFEVRRFVGNGKRKLIERALPGGSSVEQIEKVLSIFSEYYALHSAVQTKAYDGIPELLSRLRGDGIRTAVVSNKSDGAVQGLVKDYFDGLFDFALGEREGVPTKPSPEMARTVLKALDIPERDAVYIGDSDVDIQTAQNAGLDGIFVEWGFRGREFLLEHGAKPERICRTPAQVYELVTTEILFHT